jgi:hypothetical protein
MRRLLILSVAAAMLLLTMGLPALAGNPHFVGTPTITRDGNSLTVEGKIAGLGNEPQVHVEISVDAACINPGSKKPQAANKESFSAQGDFPVQNGKAEFSLTVTATFSPNCSPPMTVVFSNLVVTADGLTRTFQGPF